MAVVSLAKGGSVSLSKQDASLKTLNIGLGWDVSNIAGSVDMDASAFMLNGVVSNHGKVLDTSGFIFYNNNKSPCGSVVYHGDNRTGAGDGDDETLTIELDKVPSDVQSIAFSATIHTGQKFNQVKNAFIRCVNAQTNTELARFDLSSDAVDSDAVIFGEVYRDGGEWKFRAIGDSINGGLAAVCGNFGINAA